MNNRLFNVTVHYQNDLGEMKAETVTILAPDDVKARAEGIKVTTKSLNSEMKEFKKLLFCEVEYRGTVDGRSTG